MGLRLEVKGDWKKTFAFLNNNANFNEKKYIDYILNNTGRMGVSALSSYTPIDTGLASKSWSYYITKEKERYTITWTNDDVEGGCNVAILIQYGHGTRNGGFVRGYDFINPSLKPVFEKLANDLWEEVTKNELNC